MTPEIEKRILWCLKKGMSLAHTLQALHIADSTFYKHCKLPHNQEFSTRVEAACLKGEANSVERINNGSKGWQGAAWLLSKKYPDRYGRKVDEAPPIIQPIKIMTQVKQDENSDTHTEPKAGPVPSEQEPI